MASLPKLFLFIIVLVLISSSADARPVMHELAARLQSDGLQQCWGSLMELRACTGEVILFFLNGETYLGPACCRSVRVIEHRCWAADAMLAALGFTVQEGDVLRGYCDAADHDHDHDNDPSSAPQSAPPSPPASPRPSSAATSSTKA